jgi:hypothetical protein
MISESKIATGKRTKDKSQNIIHQKYPQPSPIIWKIQKNSLASQTERVVKQNPAR